MWLMLQQDKPDDYVIATGESHSLEEFVSAAFAQVGLDWHDHVAIDPEFFRPTEIAVSRGTPKICSSSWLAGSLHDAGCGPADVPG